MNPIRPLYRFFVRCGDVRLGIVSTVAALVLSGCASQVPPLNNDSRGASDSNSSQEPRGLDHGSTIGSTNGSANGTMQPPAGNANRAPFAGCSGSGPVTFANAPMRDADFTHLLPYGLMVGAHVTPIDHMYFSSASSQRDAHEVRAIANGVIYSLQPRDINVDTGAVKQREWRMDIAHTCTFTSYFDLLTSIDPALEAEYNRTQGGRTGPWNGVAVAAGQVVGRIGAQTLDFGVYDYNVTLPGFVVPSHYVEPWKIHTVDPFPHFPEPTRSSLLSKMLRVVEPRAGKIDYDVDGRLVGNWFQQGTNGYAGLDLRRYWDGHLAFAYDYLDPTQLRFSIGNWTPGREAQFGVKGNAPDWANVSNATGRITLELVQFDYYAENEPNRTGSRNLHPGDVPRARNAEDVRGVALVEMIGLRTVRVEVFPGMQAAEVNGFTAAARTYER